MTIQPAVSDNSRDCSLIQLLSWWSEYSLFLIVCHKSSKWRNLISFNWWTAEIQNEGESEPPLQSSDDWHHFGQLPKTREMCVCLHFQILRWIPEKWGEKTGDWIRSGTTMKIGLFLTQQQFIIAMRNRNYDCFFGVSEWQRGTVGWYRTISEFRILWSVFVNIRINFQSNWSWQFILLNFEIPLEMRQNLKMLHCDTIQKERFQFKNGQFV
jgi:hypothetical protein